MANDSTDKARAHWRAGSVAGTLALALVSAIWFSAGQTLPGGDEDELDLSKATLFIQSYRRFLVTA